MDKRVSVILPIYNEDSSVGQVFDSVLDFSRKIPTMTYTGE